MSALQKDVLNAAKTMGCTVDIETVSFVLGFERDGCQLLLNDVLTAAKKEDRQLDAETVNFVFGFLSGMRQLHTITLPTPGISSGVLHLHRKGKQDSVMPMLGLGTWKAQPGEVGAAIISALKAGYRHIDAAACYGNEKEVGQALSTAFTEHIVRREDVFVTSKLWNSEHAAKDVRSALQTTLADLQLDYLDLYLIHWPQAFQHVDGSNRSFPRNEDGSMKYDTESLHEETWKELEACIDAGLARNIGLSNFTKSQIENILSFARIPPAVLQVEVHPFFQQEKLVSFAHSRGIRVTGYSPLGSGSQVDGHTVPTHPALKKIGEKYGKSAAQVALRLQIQRGIVMIPKSVKEKRIQDNIALDFELSDKDMAELKTLDQNIRTGWGGPVVERDGAMRPRDELHPYYPFKMLPNGENDADIY